jgi:hypothetical protein
MKNFVLPGLIIGGILLFFGRQKRGAEDIRATVSNVDVIKFDPSGITLRIAVRVQNLSKFAVMINSVAGELLSGGGSQATFQSEGIGSIPGNSTKTIELKANVPTIAAARSLLKFGANPANYINSLTVRMLINTPQAQFTINTDLKGNLIAA